MSMKNKKPLLGIKLSDKVRTKFNASSVNRAYKNKKLNKDYRNRKILEELKALRNDPET